MFTHLNKHSHIPKLHVSNNSVPLKTANPRGELELILAGLAEATPRGNDDTDLYVLFLAAAVLKLLRGSVWLVERDELASGLLLVAT